MINTDLRVGNQVLFSKTSSTVTILNIEDNKVLLDTFPASNYVSESEVSGIPLTSSILQQLNFSNEDESTTWIGQGISIHIKPDGFYYGLRIFKSRTKIQYLHQLQNYIADYYTVFKEQERTLNFGSYR